MNARTCICSLGLCTLALYTVLTADHVAAQDASPAGANSAKRAHEHGHSGKKSGAKRSHGGKGSGSVMEFEASRLGKPATVILSEPDPKLIEGLAGRIRQCYRDEAGRDLSDEDAKLLDEFKPALARELEPGFAQTGCKSQQPASEACLQALSDLPCPLLARPISSHGWDRHLLPKDRRALTLYTSALAERKAQCRAERGVQSDAVEQDMEATRLGLVAAMNIAEGRCQLNPAGPEACDDKLAKLACSEVEAAIVHNRVINLCPQFLRCRSGGPTVE